MMSEVIDIKVNNLNKSFNHNHVLQDINFSLSTGESLVIIGGSGSGKSVLLKAIAGLLIPDAGSRVEIGKKELTYTHIAKRKDFRQTFGMLFQGSALFDSLSVWRNIAFGLQQQMPISKEDARNIAIEKLKLVGLKPEIANLYPSEISGGMQKRVSLARTIANDPKLIFFDEPTTGLDPIMAAVISDLIVKVTDELNATAITITHDMSCMRRIADKVGMLYNGQLIWKGSPEDAANCDNTYVKQFVTGSIEGPINHN